MSGRPGAGNGSMILGIGISVAALLGAWLLGTFTGQPDSDLHVNMAPVLYPVLVGVVVGPIGMVLCVGERTVRVGAGMLIGLGIVVLVAGGVCAVMMARF
jgi:hypothetical protein